MTDSIEQFAQSFQENVRLPGPQNKVYKDECIYSFDTPVSTIALFDSRIVASGDRTLYKFSMDH
jgi:hypothetical protein